MANRLLTNKEFDADVRASFVKYMKWRGLKPAKGEKKIVLCAFGTRFTFDPKELK